jgi:hypothetical protein
MKKDGSATWVAEPPFLLVFYLPGDPSSPAAIHEEGTVLSCNSIVTTRTVPILLWVDDKLITQPWSSVLPGKWGRRFRYLRYRR